MKRRKAERGDPIRLTPTSTQKGVIVTAYSNGDIIELCGRCETTLRKSGKLLHRIGRQPNHFVICSLCRQYLRGGKFLITGEWQKKGK